MKDHLNDLWKYSNGSWNWISGSNIDGANGTYGTQGVPSISNYPGARDSMGFLIDSSGSIWIFGGYGYDSVGVAVVGVAVVGTAVVGVAVVGTAVVGAAVVGTDVVGTDVVEIKVLEYFQRSFKSSFKLFS